MSFDTFDFRLKKIKVQLEVYKKPEQKLIYLGFVKKELNRIIRCFQSDRFVHWRTTSDDCEERDKFYRERFKYLSSVYGENDQRTYDAVEESIKEKIDELIDCLKNIEDEIEYISKYKNDQIKITTDEHKKEIIAGEQTYDQDTLLEKFKLECQRRSLVKYKTIPPAILYEIAKTIGMKVGKIEEFKAKEHNYQIARQYASLTKYSSKKPRDR